MAAPPPSSQLAFPFDDDSKTGFELELLAPEGSSRRALAARLADRLSGRLEAGFKYHSEGPWRDGRPVCDLTPAWRVVGADGDGKSRVELTVVDDVTINADLDKDAESLPGWFRVVLDDLRIALWAEARSWSPASSSVENVGRNAATTAEAPQRTLAELLQTFDGTLLAPGQKPAQDPRHRAAIDPWGHTLFVLAGYEGQRERVCEVVTRPLGRDEREDVLGVILTEARELGFSIPAEAALHVHLDRGPWMRRDRLAQLVVDVAAARPMLIEELKPNPRCRRLGTFASEMVRLAHTARDAGLTDEGLRDKLRGAGVSKYVDFNILGIVSEHPRQPTLEVRCLPMSLDPVQVMASVTSVEEFLTEVALTADAR